MGGAILVSNTAINIITPTTTSLFGSTLVNNNSNEYLLKPVLSAWLYNYIYNSVYR